MRNWYNVELDINRGMEFKELLEKIDFGKGFKYESSSCGELMHFELYLESNEVKTCNIILDLI